MLSLLLHATLGHVVYEVEQQAGLAAARGGVQHVTGSGGAQIRARVFPKTFPGMLTLVEFLEGRVFLVLRIHARVTLTRVLPFAEKREEAFSWVLPFRKFTQEQGAVRDLCKYCAFSRVLSFLELYK